MPDRMCAPTSEPFSTTTTEISALICLRRMAAASPAGPAPTTTTSNSIASRAGNSAMNFSQAILYFCTWGGNRETSMLMCINGPRSRKFGARSA